MKRCTKDIVSLSVMYEPEKHVIEWCDGHGNVYSLEESSDLSLDRIDLFDYVFSHYPVCPVLKHNCSWPTCMGKNVCPM